MHTFDQIDSTEVKKRRVYTVYTFLTENLSISEDTSSPESPLIIRAKKGLGILNLGSSGRGGVSLRGEILPSNRGIAGIRDPTRFEFQISSSYDFSAI